MPGRIVQITITILGPHRTAILSPKLKIFPSIFRNFVREPIVFEELPIMACGASGEK
jgi:hypothetical protein